MSKIGKRRRVWRGWIGTGIMPVKRGQKVDVLKNLRSTVLCTFRQVPPPHHGRHRWVHLRHDD
ncbi:hypothetical protein, partial [Streptomyces jumonjinensis]|uniref:hypothetical protein n=1 Tax=Streptomyces jumonjinensis TaxID=1945 RepID=UPI001E53A83B